MAANGTPVRRKALILTQWLRPVLAHLEDLREDMDAQGNAYDVGVLRSEFGDWEVAVALTPTGGDSGPVAGRAITRFRPDVAIVLVPVRSMQSHVSSGSVVIATMYYEPDFNRRYLVDGPFGQQALRLRDGESTVHAGGIAATDRFTSKWQSDAFNRGILAYGIHSELWSVTLPSAQALDLVMIGCVEPSPGAERWDAEKAPVAALNFVTNLLRRFRSGRVESTTALSPLETQYITEFHVEHVRSIGCLSWELAPDIPGPGWHVLVGGNGSGKTTILRLLAMSLWGKRETDALDEDWAEWIQLGTDVGRAEVALSGTALNSQRRLTEFRRPSELFRDTDQTEAAPVFSAGYGAFRRFLSVDPELDSSLSTRYVLSRHATLFKPRSSLADGLAWLKNLHFKYLEGKPEGRLLDDVKKLLNSSELLPDGTELKEVSTEGVFFSDGNSARVEIGHLSDGYHAVLSLVLDLLRHMAVAYGPFGVFGDDPERVSAPGIVFIDEVDVHVHPTWQQKLGIWFQKYFPNVQFFVATHSLIACQAAASVFVLPSPGKEGSGRMLEGVDLDRVRFGNVLDGYGTGLFGHGVECSEESRKMRSELARLNLKELDGVLTPDEEVLQDKLRAVLPTPVQSGEDGRGGR